MTTFFTADLHFGHANILRYSGRPFADIGEHDEELVRRWNAVVDDGDMVWVLGDVAMGSIFEGLHRCAQLKGTKVLISGNHDRTFPGRTANTLHRQGWVIEHRVTGGFAIVLPGSPVHITAAGDDVTLSHFPYEADVHDGNRFAAYRPLDEGGWLLHGHVHTAWKVRGRQINVGVDQWDFAPVAERQIAELIKEAG